MKSIILLFSTLFFIVVNAQNTDCDIKPSIADENIKIIDVEKMKCLAKQSDNKTLFFTFGVWCEPCRLHIKDALEFVKKHNLNFYVVLVDVDKLDSRYIMGAKKFLQHKDENINILIADNKYGNSIKKKNKNFVKEVSLPNFENINDFSKYILINTKGEIEMVTNYKDREKDEDWRDDTGKIKRKLEPLVVKL